MERCFSCSEIAKCTELYARKPFDYRGPYFPIFERFNPPSISNSISQEGTVKVCDLCHIFLLSQWQNYERQGIVESRRIYFTKRQDKTYYNANDHFFATHTDVTFGNKPNYSVLKNGFDQRLDTSNKTPITVSTNMSNKVCLVDSQSEKNDLICDLNLDFNSKHLTEHHICCFVCGLPCLKWHAKTAYSSQVLENKEYFPFFEKLDAPQLSIGLTNGATKICTQCESDLQKQWEHYDSIATDQMLRTYHITNDHNNSFSITNPGRFITNAIVNHPLFSVVKMKNSTIKCAICTNKVIDPYTVSWNQRTSSLFISNLKNFSFPSEGVIVDKQSEEAIICDVCHYFLSYQMQAYNASMTPNHLREYKLPKVGSLSSTPEKQSTNNRKAVTLGSSSSAFSAPEGWQPFHSQIKRSKTPITKNRSKTPVQLTENNRLNSLLKMNAGNQDQSCVLGPIIANCHICLFELRDPTTLKTLPSTVSEESPDQAYFPFLKTLRMNSMKNYEFPVCVHCFYNLHGQWRIFHKAAVPIYERKYTNNEFMCTQCQHLFAQKTDIVIVRDRLLCVSCSENRGCDATKNASNDTDTSSHNSLLSLKTKTTVTVTPISNELSCPNLASLNYTETIKQLSSTKLFDSTVMSKPISSSIAVNHFSNLSQNSSLPSDLYQNSKNIFSKNMKRPVVAAVAPNQRQNTPHISSESVATHSNLRHKMPEISNYHGNSFNQNSAFSSFSGSGTYPLPIIPSNPAFVLHSQEIGRKSSKLERDHFMKHAVGLSNPYFDQNSRVMTSMVSNTSNPFMNWTEQPILDQNNVYPLSQSQPFSSTDSNKEAEMTMLLYMMYQKQMHSVNDSGSSKVLNNWLGNMSFEDVALNCYQSMMSPHSNSMGFPLDDLRSGIISNANNNGYGNIQSYMLNAAIAKSQYSQMIQMLAAYQHHSASASSPNPSVKQLPANVPSWFNQLNITDPSQKRVRSDNIIHDKFGHSKSSSTPNLYNNELNIMMHSEMLNLSMGNGHDNLFSGKYPSTNVYSSNKTNNCDISMYSNKLTDSFENLEKLKTSKELIGDHSFSDLNHNVRIPNILDDKTKRPFKWEFDAIDLSQNKPAYKSAYAIDSLTDLEKSYEIDYEDLTEIDHKSTLKFQKSYHSAEIVESSNKCNILVEKPKSTGIEGHAAYKYKQNGFIDLLYRVGAPSLIDLLKIEPMPLTSKLSITQVNKWPTVLKIYKFLNQLNHIYYGYDDNISIHTRRKNMFMKELGLQSSFSQKKSKSKKATESYIMQKISNSRKSLESANEVYWTKWILKNLQHRLSKKVKPHLRRSLMRPVLFGNIGIRLCAAKHKHELESLRNIIKILIRFT